MFGTTRAQPPSRLGTLRFLLNLPRLARVCWRLLRDRRVAVWAKAILIGAVLYVILPFDLIPDGLLGLGQLDDLTILVLAARWFLEWCPPDVVREHAGVALRVAPGGVA